MKREYIQDGRQEGRQEGKIEIARALLTKGLAFSFIAEVTGLTEAEIAQLQEP